MKPHSNNTTFILYSDLSDTSTVWIAFGKLEEGSAERTQQISNAKSIKDLYVNLTLVDLKEIASMAPSEPEVEEDLLHVAAPQVDSDQTQKHHEVSL